MSDPGIVDDSVAYATGLALGGLIPAELDKRNLPGVCDGGIMPGAEVAFDECGGECPGLWWVRPSQVYPSYNFPTSDQLNHGKRLILLAQQYEVGVVRSIEVSDNGEATPFEVLGASARLQLADMRALLQVICSYFKSTDTPFIVGAYTPYGPQGGCVGGSWVVTAGTKPFSG